MEGGWKNTDYFVVSDTRLSPALCFYTEAFGCSETYVNNVVRLRHVSDEAHCYAEALAWLSGKGKSRTVGASSVCFVLACLS
jgi:hypothetical protein